jgi:hypothetical protein
VALPKSGISLSEMVALHSAAWYGGGMQMKELPAGYYVGLFIIMAALYFARNGFPAHW